MGRTYDPMQVKHPKLRELDYQAAWIAAVAEAAEEIAYLLEDVLPDEWTLPNFDSPWPWDFDPMVVALSVVQSCRDEGEKGPGKSGPASRVTTRPTGFAHSALLRPLPMRRTIPLVGDRHHEGSTSLTRQFPSPDGALGHLTC